MTVVNRKPSSQIYVMDWLNVFKSCMWLKYLGKSLMVVIVASLVMLATYSVWTRALLPGIRFGRQFPQGDTMPYIGGQVWYFILSCIYIGSIVMLIWCYVRTMMDCPGRVPESWFPFSPQDFSSEEYDLVRHDDTYRQDILDRYANDLKEYSAYALENGKTGKAQVAFLYATRPRWCKKCRSWKPPRSHHCSMTNACILKMDHYCVWMTNTIGALNYKSFVLFLGWTCFACLLSAVLLFKPCVIFVTDPASLGQVDVITSIVAFMSFVFTAAFTLALIGFLIMHGNLIRKNMTTIEAYEKETIDPWPHDKGSWKDNVCDVLGRGPWYRYLIPILTDKERRGILENSSYLKHRVSRRSYQGIV